MEAEREGGSHVSEEKGQELLHLWMIGPKEMGFVQKRDLSA